MEPHTPPRPEIWLAGLAIAVALLLVAAAVIVSVLVAANRSVVSWRWVKSALGLALWIVPAVGIVAAIAANSRDRFYNPPDRPEVVPVIEVRPVVEDDLATGVRRDALSQTTKTHAASFERLVLENKLQSIRGVAQNDTRGLLWWLAGSAVVAAMLTLVFSSKRPIFPGRPWTAGLILLLWAVAGGFAVACLVAPMTTRDLSRPASNDAQVSLASNAHFANSLNPAPPAGPVTAQRLKTRQVSSDAPQWADQGKGAPISKRDVLNSKLYASVEEAEADVTAQAVLRVRDRFREALGATADWVVPVTIVDQFGVKDFVTETVDKDFGEPIGKAKMYRAHVWLDYSERLRDALAAEWRGQLVEQRLIVLTSILGLVTLMLGTAAGYFRLDDLTGGRFRGRLKLAAATVVTSGALVALAVV
ncbi:MAG: hypothetical protein ACT4QC_05600 [Planctomycetaceae bacterium]